MRLLNAISNRIAIAVLILSGAIGLLLLAPAVLVLGKRASSLLFLNLALFSWLASRMDPAGRRATE